MKHCTIVNTLFQSDKPCNPNHRSSTLQSVPKCLPDLLLRCMILPLDDGGGREKGVGGGEGKVDMDPGVCGGRGRLGGRKKLPPSIQISPYIFCPAMQE